MRALSSRVNAARGDTYSDRAVHHHRADGEHQQGDGESNAGVLCMTVGGRRKELLHFIRHHHSERAAVKAAVDRGANETASLCV